MKKILDTPFFAMSQHFKSILHQILRIVTNLIKNISHFIHLIDNFFKMKQEIVSQIFILSNDSLTLRRCINVRYVLQRTSELKLLVKYEKS